MIVSIWIFVKSALRGIFVKTVYAKIATRFYRRLLFVLTFLIIIYIIKLSLTETLFQEYIVNKARLKNCCELNWLIQLGGSCDEMYTCIDDVISMSERHRSNYWLVLSYCIRAQQAKSCNIFWNYWTASAWSLCAYFILFLLKIYSSLLKLSSFNSV